MAGNIIRKFKFFGAWQDDREEAWLEEMAQQGYHLKEVGFPLVYGFEEGVPQRVVYRLDYTSLRKLDREDYFQLFHDAGWEWVGEMAGWQYFRRSVAEGETAEIYTDNQSKIEKYRRVLGLLVILLPTFVFVFRDREGVYLFTQILKGFLFMIMLLYTYGILMLIKRIKELKGDS
ncbi:MAG: DUF2812 domain-containing protein [Anaerolineales bacterium]|nr:DUF2812 domain-containing protein [Anaerolineales bacterium]